MSELKHDLYADFMRNLQGCDTVKVILTGIGETEYSTKDIYEAIDFHINLRAHPAHISDATAMVAQPANEPLTLEQLRDKAETNNGGLHIRVKDLRRGYDLAAVTDITSDAGIVAVWASGQSKERYTGKNYGKDWIAYLSDSESSKSSENDNLMEMLEGLESECRESGDGHEDYTNGYRWGHRNGQIELLRQLLNIGEGTCGSDRRPPERSAADGKK